MPNTLFKKLASSKAIVRYLGLLLPFLWLFVNLMTSFYTKAFNNSYLCQGMTLSLWIEFQIASNFTGFLDVLGRLWIEFQIASNLTGFQGGGI